MLTDKKVQQVIKRFRIVIRNNQKVANIEDVHPNDIFEKYSNNIVLSQDGSTEYIIQRMDKKWFFWEEWYDIDRTCSSLDAAIKTFWKRVNSMLSQQESMCVDKVSGYTKKFI